LQKRYRVHDVDRLVRLLLVLHHGARLGARLPRQLVPPRPTVGAVWPTLELGPLRHGARQAGEELYDEQHDVWGWQWYPDGRQ